MPKSITLRWKEYQELLHSVVEAEGQAELLQEELDDLKNALKRKDKDVAQTETYRKLYSEYAKVRDIVKVQKELELAARAAESKANAAARQLAAANEKIALTGKELGAYAELLTEARYLASDFARRTRPNLSLPTWLTVPDVLRRKEAAAKEGRVWTVQGYLDGRDD